MSWAYLGIWFGVRLGESNPGVYIVTLLGLGGVLFTMLTQLRINVTNIYSASLSLSNFFENVFHFKPDRRFWVVVSGVISIALMLGGILDYLGSCDDIPRGSLNGMGCYFSYRCLSCEEVA